MFILTFVQVNGLFKELDNVLPNNFMSQMFGDSSLQPVPVRPPNSKLTQAQIEVGMTTRPIQVLHSNLQTSQLVHSIQADRTGSREACWAYQVPGRCSSCFRLSGAGHAILVVYIRCATVFTSFVHVCAVGTAGC